MTRWVVVAIFESDMTLVMGKIQKKELVEFEKCEYGELGGCMHSKLLSAVSGTVSTEAGPTSSERSLVPVTGGGDREGAIF